MTIDFHWLTEVGLACDLFGAAAMGYDLIIPKRKAVELSLPRFPYDTNEENLKLPQVKDRLKQSRNTMIGIVLLIIGFMLQFIGNWPR
jgi:hypothetical protein